MNDISKLNIDFYLRETSLVAKDLIGKILVRKAEDKVIAAKIVETEAYLGKNDLASHSATGKSKRNAAMFEQGGRLYVYMIYGIHHCINIVTEFEGIGSAVLIRAGEPILGESIMRRNREIDNIKKLCSGPGNFAKAFGFTLKQNNRSLLFDNLYIYDANENRDFEVNISPRIGISRSKDLQLRFTLTNSEFLSRKS